MEREFAENLRALEVSRQGEIERQLKLQQELQRKDMEMMWSRQQEETGRQLNLLREEQHRERLCKGFNYLTYTS
jgi:hypothetical protein